MSNYSQELVRRYKEGEMVGEELRLFELELTEQSEYFKKKLQEYLADKFHGKKLNSIADKMISEESLLYIYLTSFEGFNDIFNNFQYYSDLYEPDPILREQKQFFGDKELTKIVRDILNAMETMNFPSTE